MTRKWLLALLALIIVVPAAAQVMQIPRPIQIQPVPAPLTVQPNSDVAEKVMTIEEAQAQIERMRAERRELNLKLAEALKTIDDMTQRGGSLVRAYCSDRSVSSNTAGATEDCGRYICGESSGICKTQCNASTDCATNYNCHNQQCLLLGEIPSS